MAARGNFSVIQGDTFNRSCTFRNKTTGVGVNLTAATISGAIRPAIGNAIPLVCTITSAVNGQFRFGLTAATTAGLTPGVYGIEVQVTYSDGTVQTLITGNLVVVKQKD